MSNKPKGKKEHNQNNKSYGLLSMMAMIIGVVIGSGIFAKNTDLLGTAGSIGVVIFTWVITSLIIITLVIAFMEVISITEITGEQSTVSNWGKHLLGIRFGKVMGYYMAFLYFPITIAALFEYSADQLLATIQIVDYDVLVSNKINYTLWILIITLVLVTIVMLLNAFFTSPGRYLQNIGTVIKTIPLFFVIFIFLILIGNADSVHFYNRHELSAMMPSDSLSQGSNLIWLMFATMPAILFSFDGYLIAGTLSNESKSPTTFRFAFIFSIIFIIIVYLLFSVATLGLGDPSSWEYVDGNVVWENGVYGSITNVIYSVGESNGWSSGFTSFMSTTTNLIVLLSMLTGASGFTISASRTLSDLSASHFVKDEDDSWVTKNKYGVAQRTGLIMLGMTILWFMISITFDIWIVSGSNESAALGICDFSSNMVTVLIFLLQSIIIIAAIANRFKRSDKQVRVKKNKLFLPCAVISSFMMLLATSYFAYSIFVPIDGVDMRVWITSMVFTIFVIIGIIVSYVWCWYKTKDLTEYDLRRKDEIVARYYNMEVNEYLQFRDGYIEEDKEKTDL